MATPPATASDRARVFRAPRALSDVTAKFLYLARNARHIQRLLREPHTIGPESAASLVRTVNLVIEPRCNLRCRCCHFFKSYDDGPVSGGLELPQLLALTDEVPQASVALTGGEPLLSPVRVVEAAKVLLRKGRPTMVPTNALPVTERTRGELVRAVLLNGLDPSQRAKLRLQCSVDREHQQGGRFSVEEYVSRCHAAIRFLVSAGFPVSTRSIVTDALDYAFYREHVLPLVTGGVTCAATVQPDMYNFPGFAAALQRGELGDVTARLGQEYVNRLLRSVGMAGDDGVDGNVLPTAPWVLIEINERGVKGPSGFLPATAHHPSVVAMLRCYDWLKVADAIVPQITITKNAFPYRVKRKTRAVSINFGHVLNRLVHR